MLLFIFQFKGPSATSIDAEACEHDMELVGKLTANASVIHVAIFLLLFFFSSSSTGKQKNMNHNGRVPKIVALKNDSRLPPKIKIKRNSGGNDSRAGKDRGQDLRPFLCLKWLASGVGSTV